MEQENQNLQNEDIGQKLNAVLSDPESLSRLAGMASALASSGVLSGLAGGLGVSSDSGASPPEEASAANADGAQPAVQTVQIAAPSGQNASARGISGRHSALLRAIKPYLGEEKQARVDQMMKLLQLAELADTVLRGGM